MENIQIFIYASLLLLLGHVIRAARWAMLFRKNQIYRRFDLLLGLALGYAINAILPWRVGELLRIWFVARRCSLPLAPVLTTVVAERLSDLFIVVAIGLVMLYGGSAEGGVYGILSMLGVAFSLLLFAYLVQRSRRMRHLIWQFASVFNERNRFGIIDFSWSLSETVTSGRLLRPHFLLATVCMWAIYLSSYLLFARAVGQSLGEMVYLMVGWPFGSGVAQAVLSQDDSAMALFGFMLFPVLGILVWGGIKQYTSIIQFLTAWRRYGWYGAREVSGGMRTKFKADSEYEFFLVSLFSGDNAVATSFGLEAIDDGAVTKLFAGGSDAITALVEVENKLLIRKFAVGPAGHKLKVQHDWILQHRIEKFPLVEIMHEQQRSVGYYYDMPLVVPSNDFYDFIHTNPIQASKQILREVTERIADFHESCANGTADDTVLGRYLNEKAVLNAKLVLDFAKTIFPNGEYTINSQKYDFSQWDYLQDSEWLMRQIHDRSTTVVHGDLTIENIIVAPQWAPAWYIIDPNPENVFNNHLIDWAKLMQSVHLGYEGLNRSFGCVVNGHAIQLALTKSQGYTELHSQVEDLIVSRFGKDALREVYFHELIHYLRLTPYKIRQDPRKGLCFFACTSILLGRYLELANQ